MAVGFGNPEPPKFQKLILMADRVRLPTFVARREHVVSHHLLRHLELVMAKQSSDGLALEYGMAKRGKRCY